MESPADIDSVTPTVMAIREEIMQYFKGDCVERLTRNRNVDVVSAESGRNSYQYERREANLHMRTMVRIAQLPVLLLQHHQDTLTIYRRVLQRSPQFKKIQAELERFMAEYLPAVKLDYSDETGVFYAD